jgi:predicted methyltransferase
MNRFLLMVAAAIGSAGCGAARSNVGPAAVVQNTGVEVPSGAPAVPARVRAVLAEPDRPAAERALDGPRQAAQVLAYLDVAPGMSVAVLAPGSGYFMELLARSVGPDGRIFARNPPLLLSASDLTDAWDARLARPAGARVVRIDGELGKELDVRGLDLVFLAHDYDALRASAIVPAAAVARAWYALRDGGRLVVVEREAIAANTSSEIESHGFRKTSEGRFLGNGTDPCDWDVAPSDTEKRVLLTFEKPSGSLEGPRATYPR